MTVSIGPTVRRRRLGTELRRLREAHSIKLEEVAEQLGVAASTLSRIETGKAPTRSAYLTAMLKMYGVEDPGQRQVLVDMAREGHRKGWWAAYEDVLPTGFGIYVGLEAEAASLRAYESLVIHGLLQTEDYARSTGSWRRTRSSGWYACAFSGRKRCCARIRWNCGSSWTRRYCAGRSAGRS